jgi:acetyltransferase-like isoleucine patch superfamily enzyme
MVIARKIFQRFVKETWWRPPRRIRAGAGVYIYRPRRIDGPQFIQFGARSTVDRHGWLSALESYGDTKYEPRIVIGNDVHIGRYACVTSISSIVIEDGCLISEHVYISDHGHAMDPHEGLIVDQPLVSKGPVQIGAHTFIGYRACVLPGVTLGMHCVVGANSVVTRSFPDFSVVAGCPARLIRVHSSASARVVAEGPDD